MNSSVVANQIAWTLQGAIAVTFAFAQLGLAVQLKRPATRALALGWLWTTVALLAVAIDSFVDPTDRQTLPTLIFGGLTLAGFGASLPAFETAARQVVSGTEVEPLSRLVRRSVMWALTLLLVTVFLVLLGQGPFAYTNRLVGMVGRLVIVALYGRSTLSVWRSRQRADARFTSALTLLTAALVFQAARPILLLAFVGGPPSGELPTSTTIAFVGIQIFGSTLFGVSCLLLALAEERAATLETGRRLRDAALRMKRSHSLESVGRLASGVAHDFNNLPTIISSSVELARDTNNAQARSPHIDVELVEIANAASRGATLTRQLTFARPQPQSIERFDVGARVRRMTSLMERLVGAHIRVSVTVAPTSTVVTMDPAPFEQVLVNLMANARDAMPKGGDIAIDVGVSHVDSLAHPALQLTNGHYVKVAVADTGRGIDAAAMPHLFEPFFTTRHEDGGTGLGLASVLGIVRRVGGDVLVDSVLGKGSMFTVFLPSADEDIARRGD